MWATQNNLLLYSLREHQDACIYPSEWHDECKKGAGFLLLCGHVLQYLYVPTEIWHLKYAIIAERQPTRKARKCQEKQTNVVKLDKFLTFSRKKKSIDFLFFLKFCQLFLVFYAFISQEDPRKGT